MWMSASLRVHRKPCFKVAAVASSGFKLPVAAEVDADSDGLHRQVLYYYCRWQ
jgi:hypothetical protein